MTKYLSSTAPERVGDECYGHGELQHTLMSPHKTMAAPWDLRPVAAPNPNPQVIDPSTGWPVSVIMTGNYPERDRIDFALKPLASSSYGEGDE